MTDVLTVGALGSVLLARWKLLVAFVLLGVAAGVSYGIFAPASYTSKAVLFVIAAPADKEAFYPAAQFAEKRAATYPALLSAPQVIERTRAALNLDLPAPMLIPMLTATNPTASSLIEVTATASTPKLAQDLAGTAARYLADYAVTLEDNGTKVGAVSIEMAVPAREPTSPSSPSPMVLGALGGLAGGAIGVVTALVANAMRRRNPRDGAGQPKDGADQQAPGVAGPAGPSAQSAADGAEPPFGRSLETPVADRAELRERKRKRRLGRRLVDSIRVEGGRPDIPVLASGPTDTESWPNDPPARVEERATALPKGSSQVQTPPSAPDR